MLPIGFPGAIMYQEQRKRGVLYVKESRKVFTDRNTGIQDKRKPGIPGCETQRNYPKEQIPGCQERRQQPFPTGTKSVALCYQQNKTHGRRTKRTDF